MLGGGALGAVGPSTALRAVPLPIGFADREDCISIRLSGRIHLPLLFARYKSG
jgi:hypothetical protein